MLAITVYVLVGLLFGIAFISKGYRVLEPAAAGSPWGFRLLLLPANLVLWPYLLFRWVSASRLAQSDP